MATFKDTAAQVIQRLQSDLDLTPAQAAGIVGQLGYESDGLQAINERKPVVPGSRGGFGWAQWTGPRRKQFEAFAANQGWDVTDPEANYQYLLHELTATPERKVLDSIRGIEDPKQAGKIFTDQFLRPGVKAQDKRDTWVDRAVAAIFPAAQAGTLDAKLADDPLFQMLSAQDSAPATAQDVPEKLATDPVWQMLNAAPAVADQPVPTSPAAPLVAAETNEPGVFKNFVRGVEQGLGDLPAGIGQNAMHEGLRTLQSIDDLLGTNFSEKGAQNVASRDAEVAQREQDYQAATPGSFSAGAGRFVGTALPMVAGGPMRAAMSAPGLTGTAAAAQFLPPTAARLIGGGAGMGLQGASFGAVSPVTSGDYGSQQLRNITTGGVIGALSPTIGAVVGGTTKAVGRGLRGLIDPFTEAGRDRIAASTLARAAGGSPIRSDLQQIVPGSTPTLAEVTGNPGIAGLQRTMRDLSPGQFVEREQANAAARLAALQGAAGTADDVAAAEAARALAANQKLPQVFGNAQAANPSPAVQVIDDILAGPSGKRDAVKNSLSTIRSKIVDSKGILETNPETLYNSVRKQIDDLLDARMANSNPGGLQASRELLKVKDALDDVIQQAAPGFREYLNAYSSASKPIDAMRHLQGLNLTDAQGNITLAKVQSALKGLEKAVAKHGASAAKSVTDTQIATLSAIRDDLLRAGRASLGRSIGSNTAQNLATQSMLNQALPGRIGAIASQMPPGSIGAGLGGLAGWMSGAGPIGATVGAGVGGSIGRTVSGALNMQNEAIQGAIQQMLLNSGKGLTSLQNAARLSAPRTQFGAIERFIYPSITAGGIGTFNR